MGRCESEAFVKDTDYWGQGGSSLHTCPLGFVKEEMSEARSAGKVTQLLFVNNGFWQ